MDRKTRLLIVSLCLVMGTCIVRFSVARPSEPITNDYAVFTNDPYPMGPNDITIDFVHESFSNFIIYLYRFDDVVTYWTIDRYTGSGNLTYQATSDGVWRLLCHLPGYQDYWTDETYDEFSYAIADPYPNEGNLDSDWVRHPEDLSIRKKAMWITGCPSDSYVAAQNIKTHVRDYFVDQSTFPGDFWFQPDLNMLSDLNTYGHYYGNCRSDAGILTAYARALGIPARIIQLHIHIPEPEPWGINFTHYFAEFYVLNGTSYQWIPVDSHPDWDWFGLAEANAVLSRYYEDGGHFESSPATIYSIPQYGVMLPVAYTGDNLYTIGPSP